MFNDNIFIFLSLALQSRQQRFRKNLSQLLPVIR